VVFGERFRRFVVMFFRVFGVRMRENRMMRSLLVLAIFMVLGRCPMVFGGFFVMLSGGGMMLDSFLGVRHLRHSQNSAISAPGKDEAAS
jgi:hypothetical protein